MATDTKNSTPITATPEEETTATTTAAAAATTEGKRMLVLKSNDSETFEVEEEVAKMSETIKQMLEDDMDVSSVPIPNVNGATLAKVIEYCKHKAAVSADDDANKWKGKAKAKADDAMAWEKEFVKMDDDPLFSVLLAANYLNIKTLLDLCCQTIADKIKDFTVEEVRKVFSITNDFTPEEEATIRSENAWAFE